MAPLPFIFSISNYMNRILLSLIRMRLIFFIHPGEREQGIILETSPYCRYWGKLRLRPPETQGLGRVGAEAGPPAPPHSPGPCPASQPSSPAGLGSLPLSGMQRHSSSFCLLIQPLTGYRRADHSPPPHTHTLTTGPLTASTPVRALIASKSGTIVDWE